MQHLKPFVEAGLFNPEDVIDAENPKDVKLKESFFKDLPKYAEKLLVKQGVIKSRKAWNVDLKKRFPELDDVLKAVHKRRRADIRTIVATAEEPRHISSAIADYLLKECSVSTLKKIPPKHLRIQANLYRAAKSGNFKALRKLLKLGAKLDEPNSKGETALSIAVREEYTFFIIDIIKAGASIDQDLLLKVNFSGYDPLQMVKFLV